MSLLNFNILAVSVCCGLLLEGFAARRMRVLPAVMMLLGVAGLLAVMVYNIRSLAH